MSERVAQVLSLHRITPRCYDLTSVRTGNVRDQLIRAVLLGDALITSGVVPEPTASELERGIRPKMLVLGAGAAGLALALSAAQRGVNVTVVEKDRLPFGTLRTCYWRTVDPTEYDWPHPHWHQGTLPIQLPHFPAPGAIPFPLPPSRLTGSQLARVWINLHSSVLFPGTPGKAVPVGAGFVTILYDHDADDLKIDDRVAASALAERGPGKQMLSVSGFVGKGLAKVSTTGWTSPIWVDEPFAAIVSCIGFGEEITYERPPGIRWNGFVGHRFWRDHDGMQRSGFIPGPGRVKPTAILISGSGDGAMQDFQRAATGLFGKDLYLAMYKWSGAGRFEPEGGMRNASLAEDHARRAHGWQTTGSPIEEALAYWHKEYEHVAQEVWGRWRPQDRKDLVENVLRKEVRNYLRGSGQPAVKVQWIIRDENPTFAYGLNRLLCLLVLNLMEHAKLKDDDDAATSAVVPVLMKSTEIATITPLRTHACSGQPALCYGHPHEVVLADRASGKTLQPAMFDLILIRHGQKPFPMLGGASVPEQQVPFDLPR
jgi:hypothetical protein